jgi:hypothetical protein
MDRIERSARENEKTYGVDTNEDEEEQNEGRRTIVFVVCVVYYIKTKAHFNLTSPTS